MQNSKVSAIDGINGRDKEFARGILELVKAASAQEMPDVEDLDHKSIAVRRQHHTET